LQKRLFLPKRETTKAISFICGIGSQRKQNDMSIATGTNYTASTKNKGLLSALKMVLEICSKLKKS